MRSRMEEEARARRVCRAELPRLRCSRLRGGDGIEQRRVALTAGVAAIVLLSCAPIVLVVFPGGGVALASISAATSRAGKHRVPWRARWYATDDGLIALHLSREHGSAGTDRRRRPQLP